MALDENALNEFKNEIKTTFTNAKEENWESDQVAEALAEAISNFIKNAEVEGVEVDVVDDTNNHIGTGTQTGTVKIK